MKTNHILRVCGSVIKNESIVPLYVNNPENTFIAEANMPYSSYYGRIPENPKPNSLFLFTANCYTLEEVLRFTQKIDICFIKNINVASAILNFPKNQYPAIRIKNFPGYNHLPDLIKCYLKQGVEFSKKVQIENEAKVRIQKCFVMEELETGIFKDLVEEDKGYVLVDKLLDEEEFDELMSYIRNNSKCRLFDAVKCGLIVNSEVREMVRIFSENLNLSQLQCIRNEIKKQVSHMVSL